MVDTKTLLAIDSSNNNVSVALFNGSNLLCKQVGEFHKTSSEVIFDLIDTLLLKEKKNYLI